MASTGGSYIKLKIEKVELYSRALSPQHDGLRDRINMYVYAMALTRQGIVCWGVEPTVKTRTLETLGRRADGEANG